MKICLVLGIAHVIIPLKHSDFKQKGIFRVVNPLLKRLFAKIFYKLVGVLVG